MPGQGEWVDSLDPANGERVGRFSAGGLAEAEAAIAAARRAFARPHWAQNPRLRQQVLLGWADALERETEPLAHLLTRENGKVLAQSRGEIERSVSAIRYYAGLARNLAGHALEIAPGEFATILKEPVGVAGLIIPWNAPVNLLIRSLAPALAAGCTAVIKPAPQTSLVTAAVLRTLTGVEGLPKGAVNLVLETGHAAARHLVAAPDVDMISFTGSTAVGSQIMADAAPTLKKLSLELGGKSCCIVFDDADIEDIAPKLVGAALAISGQQCVAARRILVQRSHLPAMKAALKRVLEAIKVGPGLADTAQMGPLIDRAAQNAVHARIEQAKAEADEVVVSGGVPGAEGAFLTPTLVAHENRQSFFCQEEIFGPLIVLEGFETEEDAVVRANDTVFGLSASVWTRDGARAWRVARALADGIVWINDHGRLNAEAAAGGYRRSGIGRLYGVEGLEDFQEAKQIFQSVGALDI
ncbi:aldehyde dehydrogenase family protein [Pelagibacterium lacus]|uniref:aldehyde dehydrogenase (NAD(+)) n=2 Tax=Pelagibacterium lacus TaxID=2282655 RepID=A0A369W721_9HYPH|nr:aldehyde dehydrogenase family protein [Pelagibacterium lacus]